MSVYRTIGPLVPSEVAAQPASTEIKLANAVELQTE